MLAEWPLISFKSGSSKRGFQSIIELVLGGETLPKAKFLIAPLRGVVIICHIARAYLYVQMLPCMNFDIVTWLFLISWAIVIIDGGITCTQP